MMEPHDGRVLGPLVTIEAKMPSIMWPTLAFVKARNKYSFVKSLGKK